MRTLEDIYKDIYHREGMPQDRSLFVAGVSARAIFDFPFFLECVLGIDANDKFHMEPVPYVFTEKYILIIWPRGHLKTTIWSIAYPIWRLWKEKGIIIAITSSALDQSQRIIEEIQFRIEENEFLQTLMPKKKSETWNKTQLNMENGNKIFQTPFNSTSRGIHVDYLILDDILREENLSQEQIKDYFWSIFYPTTRTRKGQMVMVGTPMTTKDLFADLQTEEHPEWRVIKKSCVNMDENGNWTSAVWSKRFTVEELQEIKRNQGSLPFEREYMCNPMGSGANVFKNIRIGKHSELNKALSGEEYYMGIDVAMQSNVKSDFTVFSILGKDMTTGMVRQRKIERYKGWSEHDIIKRIRELHKKFNFKLVLIENVGLSVGLIKALEHEKDLPTEGFATGGRGGKKEELVSSIITGFETNVLEVLDNSLQYNELISFKAREEPRSGRMTYESVGEHDDMVIALGLAMTAILQEEVGGASIDFI